MGDPQGGGITTQGDTLAELHAMVADAVKGYYEPGEHPRQVRLHFAGATWASPKGETAADHANYRQKE